MNWPIFLLGIVIGWIIEWLVDLLFWRKRQKKWIADESGYLTQLSEVQTELESQRAQVAQLGEVQSGLEATRVDAEALKLRLAAAEAERDRLEAKLVTMTEERQAFAEQFNRLSNLAATAPVAAGVGLLALSRGETVNLQELSQGAGDDLTMIEGIGPKIQELLYQNGILTYSQLAESDVKQLQEILIGGGASFRLADPSSWPRQAKLAAAHDWVRLQTMKEQLTGGVRRPEEPAPEDDLTIIEGIGPKISASLKEHGIRTFTQLARTDTERLQAILAEAGPAFKLAAPAVKSWPEQAHLAAQGEWEQLHALKDSLKAGRGEAETSGPQT